MDVLHTTLAKSEPVSRPVVHRETPPALSKSLRPTAPPSSCYTAPASFSRSASYRTSSGPGSASSSAQPSLPSSPRLSCPSSPQSSSFGGPTRTSSTAASSSHPSPRSASAQPILQVVYTSSALTRHLSREEVSQILELSRRNNAKNDITGLLLYRDGSFVQFLEGPPDMVDSVYDRIQRDPRHHGIVRILRQVVDKRDFSKWEMAFRDLDMGSRRGHAKHSRSSTSSAASVAAATNEAESKSETAIDSEEEELQDAREGFSQLLNVGLRLGDQSDLEIRPEAYGTGSSKLNLPRDMSGHMRKLVTTFYKLMDRPL